MTAQSRKGLLASLQAIETALPGTPWTPDIDGGEWTGKFYTASGTAGPIGGATTARDGGCSEAVAIANMRNLVPRLIAFLSKEQP